jgi:hypothetical protein
MAASRKKMGGWAALGGGEYGNVMLLSSELRL